MEKIKYKTRHSKQMELHANVDDNEYLQYTKLLIWKWVLKKKLKRGGELNAFIQENHLSPGSFIHLEAHRFSWRPN